jgi:serine/threonine-protein kinase
MLQPDPAARPDSMAQVATWPLPTAGTRESQYGLDVRRRERREPTGSGARKWISLAAAIAVLAIGSAGAAYFFLEPGKIGIREPPMTPLVGDKNQVPRESKTAVAEPKAPPLLTPGGGPAPSATPTTPASPRTQTTPAGPSLTQTAKQGNTDVAALSPSNSRAEQIQRYVNQYDGGDCFFIAPMAVSANAAQIDGYGTSSSPFQVLDDAFKRTNGFEASIDVRQVTVAQCPAITFLGRLRNERARAPRIQVDQTNLRSGEALTGSIDAVGNNSVQLLLVSDEGEVQDISTLLKPSGDSKTFNLRMQRTGAAGAQPQLLVAVSSTRPLESLKGAHSTPADQLFPLALTEAARTGQAIGAAIRYFKLDR